jgi:hypothetical protein
MRRTPVIKIHGFALLLPLLAWLTATSLACAAQFYPIYPPFGYPRPHQPPPDPKDDPVEIGGYGMLGGAIEDTPPPHSGYPVGALGLYTQWNRFGFSPGLDFRIQGNGSHLHGFLVGPRVAYQPRGKMRPFRPYAEGLFGKNEFSDTPLLNGSLTNYTGVTRSIAVGLDLHTGAPFEWRVIEFSKGSFTGLQGSSPQTVMTGILIHFP